MGKGDSRRPCFVPKAQYDKNFETVFGKKKLNVMSDEDRIELGLAVIDQLTKERKDD